LACGSKQDKERKHAFLGEKRFEISFLADKITFADRNKTSLIVVIVRVTRQPSKDGE